MKRILCGVLTVLLIGVASAYAEAGRITPDVFVAKQKEGALIVDVRSPEEYASGHVDGAINIPHETIEAHLDLLGADKNRDVVLYCKSGRRAGIALEALTQKGFSKLSNAGGFSDLAPVAKVVMSKGQ